MRVCTGKDLLNNALEYKDLMEYCYLKKKYYRQVQHMGLVDEVIQKKCPEIFDLCSLSYELLTPEEDIITNGKQASPKSVMYLGEL